MQFIAAVVLQAHTRGFIDRQWVAMLRVEAARRKQREAEQRYASGRASHTRGNSAAAAQPPTRFEEGAPRVPRRV